MSEVDAKLANIRLQVKKGVVPPRETVRSLLLWFQAERRGWHVVRRIRSKLDKYELKTVPDFEYAYIDGQIEFTERTKDAPGLELTGIDPTNRIGRLDSANERPVSIKPDSTLQQAITLMLTHDFSQLPVMTTTRDVKGAISWKAIGSRLALKKDCKVVRECMEEAQIVSLEDSLFSAISLIAKHDYVLVRAGDRTICGIVTAADFSLQFGKLAEPFLLVGEIENGIRRMLRGKFTVAELTQARVPSEDFREIEGVADLAFGGYVRLLENEKHWKKLRVEIDRVEFISRLNGIRRIRNDVMHFHPDGLEEVDLDTLREFAQFLKKLREVGAI